MTAAVAESRVGALPLVGGLAVLVAVLAFLSLLVGQVPISAGEVVRGLVAGADDQAALIVREIRLPRLLLAALIGASLGISGAALQGLLRNPLAEPGLIGVSASGGLGAVVALYFGFAAAFPLALPLSAMAGALVATLTLYLLAARDASVLTLILAGVAISSFAVAMTSLALNLSPTPYALSEMVLWLLGSVKDRSMADVALAAPFILVGWVLLAGVGRGLDALSLGEEAARSLGIELGRLRALVIGGTALCVGAGVAVSGSIGFVGLVVPHLLRPIIGHQPSRLLLPSALGGAALLITADIAARLIPARGELMLGVMTAVIGAPFFLWLILKTRRTMR
ncbi:MAG: FecCD family ABC transporter permease [Alphaproteobacteria bacterium]